MSVSNFMVIHPNCVEIFQWQPKRWSQTWSAGVCRHKIHFDLNKSKLNSNTGLFGFAIILLIFASLSNMDDTDNEFPSLLLCLILTWDVVDGDGEDQEDNSSPAASCMWNLFLLFTSCFLSVWAAWVRSSPPLVHISILYFICMKEENNVENKLILSHRDNAIPPQQRLIRLFILNQRAWAYLLQCAGMAEPKEAWRYTS